MKTAQIVGSLYDSTLKCNTYDDVLVHCASVNVSVTDAQVKFVECETRQQASSPLWFKMRAGRVTASTFHAACHISLQKPSVSLLKRICTNTHFSSAATDYGIQHENNARKQYIVESSCEHVNFSCKMCGLFLNTRYPIFGASPDGLIECECCGLGGFEFLFPITLTRDKLTDLPYLTVCTIGGLQLKRSSQYFYQVHMQMLLTGRQFCDFVVWGPGVLHVERIFSDVAFIEHTTEIAIMFHAKCVMTELCVKYFTSKYVENTVAVNTLPTISAEESYCMCNGVDDGSRMICCDNVDCTVQWYHVKCLNMKRIPKGVWYCEKCAVKK